MNAIDSVAITGEEAQKFRNKFKLMPDSELVCTKCKKMLNGISYYDEQFFRDDKEMGVTVIYVSYKCYNCRLLYKVEFCPVDYKFIREFDPKHPEIDEYP